MVTALVVAVPLLFWRGVNEPFDLPKATLLWMLGPLSFVLGSTTFWLAGKHHLPRSVMIGAVAFLGASLITTVTSDFLMSSLLGQYSRYTGLVTVMSLSGVFLCAAQCFDRESVRRMAMWSTFTMVPVVVYALIQVTDSDPFMWGSEAFIAFRFSTLGNPNHAASFTAIALPLVALTMNGALVPRWGRVAAAGVFGSASACVSVFSSFQGNVAAVATVVYLIADAIWSRATAGRWAIVSGYSLLVLVAPALPASGWSVIICGLVGVGIALTVPVAEPLTAPRWWRQRRRALLVCGTALAAGGLLVAARRIISYVQEGWRSGFLERGDFYRAAWQMFKDAPVVGSGLETYGIRFPEVRPASHAINLEDSLSSSAHSVPLGMFANGGVVLGAAYLLFVGVIGWTLWTCLRDTPAAERTVVGAVGAAWLAFQIQSLVGVENVTTFLMHFVLAGMVVALAVEQRRAKVAPSGHAKGPKMRPRRVPLAAVGGLSVLCVVVSAVWLTLPLRAARAAQNATFEITVSGNGDAAVAELRRAVELAPWESTYRVRLAELYRLAGLTADALAEVDAGAERADGSPVVLAALADIAANAGDDARSLRLFEDAVAHDPHAPKLRERAAQRYVDAGSVAASAGDDELARQRYERALELLPGFDAAEQALRAL